MQPTARASFVHSEEAAAAAARASYCPPAQQQQQQYAAGGPDAAARAAQRQAWDAKLASFQRGLDHVMHCVAGDACGSSLCHATRRLMRTYATHDCANPSGSTTTTSAPECKVCKLWGYLLTKNKLNAGHRGRGGHGGPLGAARRPANVGVSTQATPTLPPLSCGLASARGRIGMRARGFSARVPPTTSSIQRRVVVTPELIKAMSKRV